MSTAIEKMSDGELANQLENMANDQPLWNRIAQTLSEACERLNKSHRNEWVSEGVKLPKLQTQCLVWVTGEDTIAVAHMSQASNGHKQWVFSLSQLDGCEKDITHWKTLPEAPK